MKELIVKLKYGGKETQMKSVIKNEMSVTSFSDPNQAKTTYESMKRAGTQVSFKDNCIIQFWLNKSENEIVEMSKAQCGQMCNTYGIKMEIQVNEI